MRRRTSLLILTVFATLRLHCASAQAQTQEAASAASPPTPPAVSKGQLLFQTDFETTDALNGWQGRSALGNGCASSRSLQIERRSDEPSGAALMFLPMPVEPMRGCTIRGTAMVKAENVTAPPQPWNGIKFMLALEAPSGRLWPQAHLETGTFDWKRVAFSARIPAGATTATLYLGLEQVTGEIWLDDVKITVAKPPVALAPSASSGPVYKGHAFPRLRGAMINPTITPDSLRILGGEWNANLIRWQLIRHGRPGQPSSLNDFDTWLESELKKVEAALPYCEKYGLNIVLDLHSPPGGKATVSGYVGSDDRLFTDPACQAKFVDLWKRIAIRFKSARPIWGYDLANEPVEDLIEDQCDDWQGLAERAAHAIRTVDPGRAIIVEPASWGSPAGLGDLVPLSVSNVVYSVHMYIPHAFTHQGVHQTGPEYRYPGMIDGRHWDKAELLAALQPVLDFQKRYGVHIYIGEFSAIRWAPDHSAYRYLKDLIEIFEAHDWDWSYHAFREWSGWSVEHGPERQNTSPAAEPTDRQRLLMEWFAQNRTLPRK